MSKLTVIAKNNMTEEQYAAFAAETGKKIAFSRTLKAIAGFYETTPDQLAASVERRVRAKRKYGNVPSNPITVILQYLEAQEALSQMPEDPITGEYISKLEAAFKEQTGRNLNPDVASRFELAYLIVEETEAAA